MRALKLLLLLGTFVFAAAGAARAQSEGDLGALVNYGALGIVTLFFMGWTVHREREHAAERKESWKAVGVLNETQQETNVILTRIETTLRERERGGGPRG